ncbi:MAG TPA: zinc ribbon domain-containing protein [Chthoniobacterales bacterium]|nr:zinc ribbon domain-containing protein [Chthoniobacterales bacterium]
MIKLVCPECRRENEPERIYCHDCGARLDRSALAKTPQKQEDATATQRRVKSMFDPRRALLKKRFFDISKLVLGALALAALIQMIRSPDLPEKPKAPMLPVQISLDVENATMTPGSTPLRYSDDQMNQYLGYALKSKQAALSSYLNFERAVVGFEQDLCRLTVERSIFGFSVYTSTAFTARVQDGNVVLANRGGAIGRMPVHPLLMQYSGVLFSDLAAVLERERKSIAKLGAVEFQPKLVVLTPR